MEMELARIIVNRGGAVEQVPLRPAPMRVHVDGSAVGDELALLETTLPPHSDGPPAHVHRHVVEVFHVLGGTLRVHAGDAFVDIGAGDTASVPTGVQHTYSNPHDEPARILIVTSSGVIPRLFRALEALPRDAAGHADPTDVAALMAKHDSHPPDDAGARP